MMKFGKTAIVSGMISVVIAALGVMLLISAPAKSKDTRGSKATSDGVITTLGF